MFSVIILCGGNSTRMNLGKNKVLLPLAGVPIFMHSLEKFKEFSSDIIVVANPNDYDEICKYHDNVVYGGATRGESVYNGILKAKYDKVLIHDGARPFVSSADIKKMIEASNDYKLLYLGSPLYDSIKDLNHNNVNREEYIVAYTPQFVKKDMYIEAFKKSEKPYSDDVSLIYGELGVKPNVVYGARENIKITTDEDYLFALERYESTRIGHSWDTHKLVDGRDLILGGVKIPFEKGLLGHSDADALLHAIAESLLGALALGDLGTHFPDNDPKYKGISSKVLLSECYKLVKEKGYLIKNIDTMIYAETPKMKPYIPLMREEIAKILEIGIDSISIKATTYEKMDAIGQGLAIACDSTVLIYKE